MYFIELIVKKFLKKEQTQDYNPLQENNEDSGYEKCEHIFMPLDSTGETLACTLCGLVVSKKSLNKQIK